MLLGELPFFYCIKICISQHILATTYDVNHSRILLDNAMKYLQIVAREIFLAYILWLHGSYKMSHVLAFGISTSNTSPKNRINCRKFSRYSLERYILLMGFLILLEIKAISQQKLVTNALWEEGFRSRWISQFDLSLWNTRMNILANKTRLRYQL